MILLGLICLFLSLFMLIHVTLYITAWIFLPLLLSYSWSAPCRPPPHPISMLWCHGLHNYMFIWFYYYDIIGSRFSISIIIYGYLCHITSQHGYPSHYSYHSLGLLPADHHPILHPCCDVLAYIFHVFIWFYYYDIIGSHLSISIIIYAYSCHTIHHSMDIPPIIVIILLVCSLQTTTSYTSML